VCPLAFEPKSTEMDQGKNLHQEEKNEIKMREKLADASAHQTSKK
jgi:hypothetical protein